MKLLPPSSAALLVACLVLAGNGARADVLPGRWEKVDAQAVGTDLVIRLKVGDRIEAAYQRSDPDNLVVRDHDGLERLIRKTDIARVDTAARVTGSGRRGALIGALAGAVPMAVLGTLLGRSIGEHPGDTARGAVILGGTGAGIGALVGYLVARGGGESETLYVAADATGDRSGR